MEHSSRKHRAGTGFISTLGGNSSAWAEAWVGAFPQISEEEHCSGLRTECTSCLEQCVEMLRCFSCMGAAEGMTRALWPWAFRGSPRQLCWNSLKWDKEKLGKPPGGSQQQYRQEVVQPWVRMGLGAGGGWVLDMF